MTIQIGMECILQSDICYTNNAMLEMAFTDFFIVKISQIELWSPLGLSNYWKRENMSGVTLKSSQEKNGGKKIKDTIIFLILSRL